MTRRQRQLRCRHHSRSREWYALSFEERATIARAHFRAGLRQVRCRCGDYVWPWELAHERLVTSGLRWELRRPGLWVLHRGRGRARCGAVLVPSAEHWRAIGPRSSTITGTLSECARRLVERVR